MMNKTTLINLILILAVAITAWLLITRTQTKTKFFIEPNQPNMVIKDFTAVRMNTDGQPKYEIISPNVINNTKTNQTDFTKPIFIIYKTPASPWIIHADKGIANAHFQKINLIGNVRLLQNPSKYNVKTQGTTDHITLFPQKKYATTDAIVKLWQPYNSIQGKGMTADMNKGVINLLSDVRATYEQNQN